MNSANWRSTLARLSASPILFTNSNATVAEPCTICPFALTPEITNFDCDEDQYVSLCDRDMATFVNRTSAISPRSNLGARASNFVQCLSTKSLRTNAWGTSANWSGNLAISHELPSKTRSKSDREAAASLTLFRVDERSLARHPHRIGRRPNVATTPRRIAGG